MASEKCPWVVTKTAHLWPVGLPTPGVVALANVGTRVSAHGGDSFPAQGLGQSDRFSAGLA